MPVPDRRHDGPSSPPHRLSDVPIAPSVPASWAVAATGDPGYFVATAPLVRQYSAAGPLSCGTLTQSWVPTRTF
jgi:hypothetical protein